MIKVPIRVRSVCHELLDQENSVTIFILSHMLLIPLEQLHNGLEEVGSDIANTVSRHIKRGLVARRRLLLILLDALVDHIKQLFFHWRRQCLIQSTKLLFRHGAAAGSACIHILASPSIAVYLYIPTADE